jgi:P-type E1-E2 ATPase
LLEEFLKIILLVEVVVACRVSPKQKADIVRMIMKKCPTKVCLAIGDGDNDVSMISTANIGIGIAGVEGG